MKITDIDRELYAYCKNYVDVVNALDKLEDERVKNKQDTVFYEGHLKEQKDALIRCLNNARET